MMHASYNGGGPEFTESTEENQLEYIQKYIDTGMPYDCWWIDAGWYDCTLPDGSKFWPLTGNWYADQKRYPIGLRPISNKLHDNGMNFLLWFEPERVREGTWLAKEHPEWILRCEEEYDDGDFGTTKNRLLNLGDPDCCDFMIGYISTLLRLSGVDIYRQDFNFEPLLHWRDNEPDDRKGMLENLYVQAYLGFWDYLLMNVPGLWIDSCSSGGRRNDLETMRRSVPLHPTDYGYGYHHINQAFRHTLFNWIPYVRSWNQSWDRNNEYYSHEDYYAVDDPSIDNFKLVNAMGALTNGVSMSDMRSFPEKIPYVNKMIGITRRFADLLLRGDFYGLTENHRSNKKWTVFQFDRPECCEGALQVLRNNQAPEESITVYPRQLAGKYTFTNEETGESFVAENPSENGVTFTLPLRAGAIWFYEGCCE